jgi:hypothetical protein
MIQRLSHVQELAGLPIELGGHMGTAVQVGHHPAVDGAVRTRAPAGATAARRRPPPGRAPRQFCAGAQRLWSDRARQIQASVLQQPGRAVRQGGVRHEQRREGLEGAGSCAPKLTPTLGHAPALTASCRSWVVSPIIRVRSGCTPNSAISSCSISGCGLGFRRRCGCRRTRPRSCNRLASTSSSPRRLLPVATPSQVVARLQRRAAFPACRRTGSARAGCAR